MRGNGGKTVTAPTLEPRPQLLRNARFLAWGWRTWDLTPSPLKLRQAEELLTKQRGARAAQPWPPQSPQFCSLSYSRPHRGEISLHQKEGTKGEVIYYSIPLCLFPEKLIMVHCCIRYFQKDYIFLLWPIKKLNPSVFLNTLQ